MTDLHDSLAIIGPALTTCGAGLLAFDVLRGPARIVRALRHTERIFAADERLDVATQKIEETPELRSTGQQRAVLAKVEERHAATVERAETQKADAETREQKLTYRLALGGLLLVVAGGLAETAAAAIAAARAP